MAIRHSSRRTQLANMASGGNGFKSGGGEARSGYRPLRLKDLAEALGLSLTTVSRALNDYPEVNRETRLRVKQLADHLGYCPSTVARGLAVGRVGVTAIVVARASDSYLDPDFTEFMAGLAEVLAPAGQDILLLQTSMADNVKTCRTVIASRRADAIVLCFPAPVDAGIKYLNDAGFPFVVYGKSDTPVPHSWVDIDHRDAAFQSASFLFEHGHERLAAIEGPAGFAFVKARMAGIKGAFSRFHRQMRQDSIVTDIFCDGSGYEHTIRLLDRAEPPTGIIYGSMLSALGGARAIRELDKQDSIAVVTHDNAVPYLSPETLLPHMATTYLSIYDVAKRVGRHVLRVIEEGSAIETELRKTRLVAADQTVAE